MTDKKKGAAHTRLLEVLETFMNKPVRLGMTMNKWLHRGYENALDEDMALVERRCASVLRDLSRKSDIQDMLARETGEMHYLAESSDGQNNMLTGLRLEDGSLGLWLERLNEVRRSTTDKATRQLVDQINDCQSEYSKLNDDKTMLVEDLLPLLDKLKEGHMPAAADYHALAALTRKNKNRRAHDFSVHFMDMHREMERVGPQTSREIVLFLDDTLLPLIGELVNMDAIGASEKKWVDRRTPPEKGTRDV